MVHFCNVAFQAWSRVWCSGFPDFLPRSSKVWASTVRPAPSDWIISFNFWFSSSQKKVWQRYTIACKCITQSYWESFGKEARFSHWILKCGQRLHSRIMPLGPCVYSPKDASKVSSIYKTCKTSHQELSHQLFLDSTLHDIWGFTQLHRTADMTHLTKHIEFNSLIYMSRIATPGDSRWQLPCFWSSVAFSNSRQPLMYSWRILCSQDSSLPCLHISKWTRFLHSLMKLEIKHKSWWSCWNRLTGLKSQIVTNKLCKVSFSKTILSV